MSEGDNSYAPEVAVFCVLIGALSLYGLNSLHGRFSNIKRHIAGRTWPFIKDSPRFHGFYIWYFRVIFTITIFMCPAAFVIWCIILFYNEYHDNQDYMPPVAITLIGVATITFALAILSLKWNRYKLTFASVIFFLIGSCCLIAYQICGNFQMNTDRSFFGLSSVFLGCNVIIFIFIILLNEANEAANFLHILDNKLDITYEKATTDGDLLALYQILDKKANRNYVTTKKEVEFFFTLEEEDTALVSGGILMNYTLLSAKTQVLITLALYLVSLTIIIAYAFVVYKTVTEYKLGFIAMAATIVIDSIIYLFQHVRITRSTFQLCLTAIIFRICLFVFGAEYWYYGYCVLYGLLGILSGLSIAIKYFPLRTTIDPIKHSVYTSNFRMELKNLMKTPEFILIYSTVIFAIITICLVIFEPSGIPLPSVYSVANEFLFWHFALLSFGIVIFCYLLFVIGLIVLRRKQKIIEEVYTYFWFSFCDIFWIYIYLCYGLLIIVGLVLYGITHEPVYIILAAFLPIALIEVIHMYVYYVANDYRVLKDIAAENQRRAAMRVAQQERAKRKFQEIEIVPENDEEVDIELDSKNSKSELISDDEIQFDRLELVEAIKEELPKETDADALNAAMKELKASEELKDWRDNYNVVTAFFKGKLYKHDYHVILCYIFILLLLFFNSLTLELTKGSDGSYYGITLGVLILDVYLTGTGSFNHVITDLPFKAVNLVLIILGLVIHIVYGLVFFIYVEDADLDVHNNWTWLLFYVFIIPMLEIIVLGMYKWHRKQWKMNMFSIVLSLLFLALGIWLGVHMWIYYGWLAGVIILLILAILIYIGLFIYCYAYNNYSMTARFYLSNVIVCVIIAILIMASGWVIKDIETYTAFSITYGVIVIGGMFYFFVKMIKMLTNYETKPIFISPYIFPVYAYSDTKKSIVTKNFNVGGAYIALLLFAIWGIITSMFIRPMYYGISVTTLAFVLSAFITFFLIIFTPMRVKEYQKWFNKTTLTDAWLEAKKLYIESQKITALEKLVTYKYLKEAYITVFNREEIKEISLTPFITKRLETGSMTNVTRHYLLAEIEANSREQFYEELELMIEFQIMALLLAGNAEINYRRKILKFAEENKKELSKLGIDIEFQGVSNQKLKYLLIINQINKLLPRQKKKFEVILAKHEMELEKKKQEEEERERQQEEERKQKLKKRSKPKIDIEAEKDLPIDEMSDSWEKYEKIWQKYKADLELGIQYKYRDKLFPPTEQSIGPNLSKTFKNWKEVNPIDGSGPRMVLYDDDEFDVDVKQGRLGDCYFLSALSVLGEKYLKECLCTYPDEIGCGAYCVRFFNDQKEAEFVLVDDYFPVNTTDNDWAFARSENEKELWPMVLEKAYAKFFGSYESIESGKVCYALADLTSGVPEQIKLEQESRNYDEFCKKIFGYYKAGYLMGAGSNANIAGNSKTINGIVQGHAYSIMELAEYEEEKLIRLRNPHGSGGVEWSGDWSDESPLWTEAAKAKLNYNVLDKRDGMFWMTLTDFIFNFDNLYVCRIFDEGWSWEQMEGEWDVTNTPGLPSNTNPNPKLESNPHYLLIITKPSTLFIELTQLDTINMSQGKHSIYFFIGNNGGKRINKTSRDIRVCSSYPPTKLITITKEFMLDNNYFYPINLSVIVATEAKGAVGKYLLKIYCTDEDFWLTKM